MAYISNVEATTRILTDDGLELTISERPRNFWHMTNREYNAKTRLYILHVGESILDNFGFGRDTRPTEFYRKNILPHLRRSLNLDGVKMTWNRKAGCAMCPCSPGYVLDSHARKDFYVSVSANAPSTTLETEEERKAAAAEKFSRVLV